MTEISSSKYKYYICHQSTLLTRPSV